MILNRVTLHENVERDERNYSEFSSAKNLITKDKFWVRPTVMDGPSLQFLIFIICGCEYYSLHRKNQLEYN